MQKFEKSRSPESDQELLRYQYNGALRQINQKNNQLQRIDHDMQRIDHDMQKVDDLLDQNKKNSNDVRREDEIHNKLIEERLLLSNDRRNIFDERKNIFDERRNIVQEIRQLESTLESLSLKHFEKYGQFLGQDTSPYVSSSVGTVQTDEPIIKIEISSSAICNESRHLYDIFSFPNYPVINSFIPNQRLRDLVACSLSPAPQEMLPNMRIIEARLRTLFPTPHSWGTSGSGSETAICEPNLVRLLEQIKIEIDSLDVVVTRKKAPFKGKSYSLATSKSSPEPFLVWGEFIVLGSEAKGVNDSQFEAMVQGFQIGGDAALWLLEKLPRELCTLPVILSFGNSFQIFGIYLLPMSVPVLVPLSSPISYICAEGRSTLAYWIILLSNFVKDTICLLDSHSSQLVSNAPKPLILAHMFFKPILGENNTHAIKLSFLLEAYRRLWQLEDASKFFLFPLGLLAYPQGNEAAPGKRQMIECFRKYFNRKLHCIEEGGCPIVAFDHLSEDIWSNSKPPQEYQPSYIDKLFIAVEKMNSVGVAHIDLRPENVMWKVENEELKEVSILIIDFEESLPFGTSFQVPACYKTDVRYPFAESSNVVVIGREHNDWFFQAIQDWTNSNDHSFTHFMSSWIIEGPDADKRAGCRTLDRDKEMN